MLNRLVIAAFVLSLHATGLFAGELYVGAGLGDDGDSGSFRQDLEGFSVSSGDPRKLFAGWRLGDHLAVEVSRYDFGDQRCCEGVADLGFTSTVDGYSAAALGRWPLGPVTPFVRAGVLSWEEDGQFITLAGLTPRSADGTDLLLGAGLEADLPAHLGLRAEWERYEFGDASSDALWACVLFRF